MKLIIIFIAGIFGFIIFPSRLRAREIIIASDSLVISGDEEMIVNATTSGFASQEAVFVKGAFYKDGSTNYFGYTKSGEEWIKNSESAEKQLKININDWDDYLVLKSDFNDTGFNGTGEYRLKLGYYYYNTSGNLSSVQWSNNILTVTINAPSPSPNPTPSPDPTSPPTPQKTPTLTPKPTTSRNPTAIPTPTVWYVKSPASFETPQATLISTPLNTASVLAASTSALSLYDLKSTKPIERESRLKFAAGLIVATGVAMVLIGIGLFVKAKKRPDGENDI